MSNALTPIKNFEMMLNKMEFAPILPSHIPEDKFKQVVVTAVQKSPELLSLNRASLFNACKECAQDGLLPDGRESALVPFKGIVKYMPMVQGITKKARNSGEIATIDALVVYENDEYDSWVDENGAHFKHRKCRGKRGNPILTYSYAITKDGSFYFEEIDEEQMKDIETCSKGRNTPWAGPFKDEMRRKSALRRLCKYRLPSSSDIDTVMHRDDDFYDMDNSKDEEKVVEEKETVQPEAKKSKLEEAVCSDDKVEDAEIKEPTPTDEEAEIKEFVPTFTKREEPEKLIVVGIAEDIKSKKGNTNGKDWTKYGIKVDGKYYGTFSRSLHDLAVTSKDDLKELEIEYETAEVNNMIFRNIINAKLLSEPEQKEEDYGEIPI